MKKFSDFYFDIQGEFKENFPLASLTWFKVGGPAQLLFIPENKDDLIKFIKTCPIKYPKTIIGAGSNLLIRDGGVPGIVISMKKIDSVQPNNQNLYAEWGALDMTISREASKAGISGLEFLIGIPGTIGGGIKMNAGSYGSEIKDILKDVEVIDYSGSVFKINSEELKMQYRKSNTPDDWLFLSCNLRGEKSDSQKIRSRMKKIMNDRKNNQPINELTGGSTFKNPYKMKSWELIDAAGCRGLKYGNAKVSEKHCNFLINNGKANSNDIEQLGNIIKNKVLFQSGVNLEWEIIRIGKQIENENENA